MAINTFELEEKLHKLNEVLRERGTMVHISPIYNEEHRTYSVTFSEEFVEDVEKMISGTL